MRRTWLPLSLCASLAVALVLVGAPALAPPGAAAVEPTFSDVSIDHPYFDAIEGMAAAQVINGFPTSPPTFRPDDPVIRQQFAKMIVLTLALPVSEQDVCGFPDVYKGGPDDFYPDNY